jgi:hypothetical protein
MVLGEPEKLTFYNHHTDGTQLPLFEQPGDVSMQTMHENFIFKDDIAKSGPPYGIGNTVEMQIRPDFDHTDPVAVDGLARAVMVLRSLS